MDVNAIWAPHALESIATILQTLPTVGIGLDALARTLPELAEATPLGRYVRDPRSLQHAIDVWRLAARHFVIALGPADVQARVRARIGALPENERAHW